MRVLVMLQTTYRSAWTINVAWLALGSTRAGLLGAAL
jgi:hypothetical protein